MFNENSNLIGGLVPLFSWKSLAIFPTIKDDFYRTVDWPIARFSRSFLSRIENFKSVRLLPEGDYIDSSMVGNNIDEVEYTLISAVKYHLVDGNEISVSTSILSIKAQEFSYIATMGIVTEDYFPVRNTVLKDGTPAMIFTEIDSDKLNHQLVFSKGKYYITVESDLSDSSLDEIVSDFLVIE